MKGLTEAPARKWRSRAWGLRFDGVGSIGFRLGPLLPAHSHNKR